MEAVLLPGRRATWEAVDERRARFRMTVGEETVEALLEVDDQGRPITVRGQRWSDRAGPGYEPFVVELAGEIRAGGSTIPSRITAGWSLGEAGELRFFRATLERATFR
jgi:hypothetical protein